MVSSVKLKEKLILALSAFCVAFSYEIKDFFPADELKVKVVGILLGLIITPQLANLITNELFKSKYVRRLVLGPSWIEGFWVVDTIHDGQPIAHGIVEFSYRLPELELQVYIYYFMKEESHLPRHSTSIHSVLREKDLLYINYFHSAGDKQDRVGVAIGRFVSDRSVSVTNRYEGKLFFVDASIPVRQFAQKLPDEQVDQLVSQHGGEWRDKLLMERFAQSSKESRSR